VRIDPAVIIILAGAALSTIFPLPSIKSDARIDAEEIYLRGEIAEGAGKSLKLETWIPWGDDTSSDTAETRAALSWSYGDYKGFIGYGTLNQWTAFRKNPAGEGGSWGSSRWSSGGGSFLAGVANARVTLAGMGSVGSRIPEDFMPWEEWPGSAARMGIVEILLCKPPFETVLALHGTETPAKGSGTGWAPGTGAQPAGSFAGASVSARWQTAFLDCDLWASTYAGRLVTPSSAGSATFCMDFGGSANGKPSFCRLEKIEAFLFLSGYGYLSPEGKTPDWDRILNAEMRGYFGQIEAIAGITLKSLLSMYDNIYIINPNSPFLERQLWRLKADRLELHIRAALKELCLDAEVCIDDKGSPDIDVSMRDTFRKKGSTGELECTAGLEASLHPTGIVFGLTCLETIKAVMKLRVEYGIGDAKLRKSSSKSGPGGGFVGGLKFEAEASLIRRYTDAEVIWKAAASLSAEAAIGEGLTLSIRASTPDDGYALFLPPGKIPVVSAGFSLMR